MNFDIRWWCLLATICAGAAGEGWRWPEGASSLRIDTKVRFVDSRDRESRAGAGAAGESADDYRSKQNANGRLSDDVAFHPPTDTEGFYNQPADGGRYPVRVQFSNKAAYRVDNHQVFPMKANQNNESTENLQYCKCVSNPDCVPRSESSAVCGADKYLCCYKRSAGRLKQQNTEFFNEIDDERPMLFPSIENFRGPFPPPPPPPPGSESMIPFELDHAGAFVLGTVDNQRKTQSNEENRPVLTGPGGPTGIVGPVENWNPETSSSAQREMYTGPEMLRPYGQRPVLIGPGGPTGIIGPNRGGGSREVLVGPRGPDFRGQNTYQNGPGVLVGPGGPTGIIGPGRMLLVGPGGPTGHIGPQNRYFRN